MLIIKQKQDLQHTIEKLKNSGKSIGFVPTMGALHNGHLHLVQQSNVENNITIVSIYVNPTQFNNAQDFLKYPKTLNNDIALLEANKADILFLPDDDEMYPKNRTAKKFNLGSLDTIWEGAHRPGHFDGVATIVDTLLRLVQPNQLYLGKKDYQQILVVKKMIDEVGHPVVIKPIETQRESSGLALSSRNLRLSSTEKNIAANIYQAMLYVKENYAQLGVKTAEKNAIEKLEQAGFKVDYLSVVNNENMQQVEDEPINDNLMIIVAAHLGEVRLIDNLSFH